MNPNHYEVQQKRAKYRKFRLIEKSGGGCVKCGYNKNMAALEFHHQEEKNFPLDYRHLGNSSWDRILKEFEKCICVCANCHRKIHSPSMNLNNVKQTLDESYDPNMSYENNCIDCGEIIYPRATRCKTCHQKSREKIKWPSTKWLKEKANEYSYLALSRRLGVSDNAIRKRIKNH